MNFARGIAVSSNKFGLSAVALSAIAAAASLHCRQPLSRLSCLRQAGIVWQEVSVVSGVCSRLRSIHLIVKLRRQLQTPLTRWLQTACERYRQVQVSA